jgi:phosphate transport system substrate-binding protein
VHDVKTFIRTFIIAATALLLASCAHSATPVFSVMPSPPVPSAQATRTSAPAPTALVSLDAPTSMPASPAPTPTATFLMPLPVENYTPDLPDPGLWAASLHIDAKDYPRVDGSTATIPLGVYLRSKITGETLEQSLAATSFTKTGPAWEALAAGMADLLVVYEAPDEVKDRLDETGVKLEVKPVGLDALVFLVNTGNPMESLTKKQIVSIYSGKTKKWSQVGGEDIDIVPYQRISNSGSQALMLKLVMKNTPMADAPITLQPAEMGELVDAVASFSNTKNAIGYSVYYYAQNMYRVQGVKLLAVDAVAPTPGTIASGSYPYVNPFYAAIRENEPMDSPARKLFDWLTTDEGKRAVKDAGYVPPK